MQEILQQRLEALKVEFEKGQARLRELQQQESQLRETLLRISGALQVLTELLEEENPDVKNKDPVFEPAKIVS
ncbi:MAG: hypothetical protein ACXWTY_08630 [Methylobacter sp.]